MVDINFDWDNYKFRSIKKDDLDVLSRWIEKNNHDESIKYSSDIQMLYRRYLEYYMTEDEVFIKVIKNDKIIAIFKGRFENFNKKELFLWLFIIEGSSRSEGIGSSIIKIIMKEFKNKYGINVIEAGVVENNIEGISFWNSLGFEVNRITEKFFTKENGENESLVIMRRKVC